MNILFGEGRPEDDELDSVGLFAIPGGDMAAGEIGREDLLRLAAHASVLCACLGGRGASVGIVDPP